MNYSAYVPCFNNAATIRLAVAGVLAQCLPPAEVLLLDDGSTDESTAQLAGLPGVKIVQHERNLGRGAARRRAMRETTAPFVLCCDATNVLQPDFAAKTLRWFDDPQVAAVFGIFRQAPAVSAAERWRGRHLFKLDVLRKPRTDAVLATSGAMVRRSAVEAVGDFDPALRHTEDADLGERLLRAGYAVVCDPTIGFESVANNTVSQVLERYWRWHAGRDEAVTWHGYARNIGFAIKSMMRDDLRAGDWSSAVISLVCPHFQFWKSRLRASHRASAES